MAILRELLLKFGLDVDEASFAKGQLAADAVKTGLSKLVEWGEAAAKGLVDLAKEAIETSAHLDDTSQAIGVSTDALQELAYAAGQSGVSAQEMERSIMLLSRSMNAAAKGGEEQAKAFSSLGVKTKNADGSLRSADDVIGDIAEKISKMPDGAKKTATAMEFFGKSGAKMVPLLNEGSEGIARLRQEAQDLGIVLDNSLIKQGAEIDDVFTSIKDLWKGIKTQVGAAFFPDILRAARAVKEWIKENRELIRQGMVRVLEGIAFAGKAVWQVFVLIQRNADVLGRALLVMAGIMTVLEAKAVLAGLGIAKAWIVALAPVLALGAVLAGILYFIDDFKLFLEYGDKADTLTGDFLRNVDKWMEPKKGDPWWVTTLKDFLGLIRDTLKAMQELDAMINGTKMHEQDDAKATASAADTTKQADIGTALSARRRYALGHELNANEKAALERLRKSDSSEGYFTPPTADFNAFKTNTGGAYAPSQSVMKSLNQSGSKVTSIAPVLNISIVGNGDEFLENAIAEKTVPMIAEQIKTTIEDAAADTE
jgi:hypothetical protein